MKRFEDQLMNQIQQVIFQDGPLEEYLQRCQENQYEFEKEAEKEAELLQTQLKAAENRMDNLLNALADNILPSDKIKHKYVLEESKVRQVQQKLSQ